MPLPIIDVKGVKLAEPTSGYTYAEFSVTLDTVPTAAVGLSYYTQGGSASTQQGDYGDSTGIINFAAGQQTAVLRIPVYADSVVEPDETFSVLFLNPTNATLAGGAAALQATGTIIGTGSTTIAGTADTAVRLMGPASVSGNLPTISVANVSTIEGASGYVYARFLVTLDKVATAPLSFDYFTQDGTANQTSGDYGDQTGTVTIQAGQQAAWISVPVYGDTAIESDEAFSLVLTNPRNSLLAGNAATLVATGTIIDDDNGRVTTVAGIGSPATPVASAASASATLPTLTVYSASTVEGQSGYHYVRLLAVLDKAPTTPVSVNYRLEEGTASPVEGDFSDDNGTLRFDAGQRSAWVNVVVYGDTRIEQDETIKAIFSGVQGAVFAGGAPALLATATIVDDDSGRATVGAIAGQAQQIIGPAASGTLPTISVVNTSVSEGNSGYHYAGVYLLLSAASTSDIIVQYATQAGTATAGEDYSASSGSVTIPAGSRSQWVSFVVYGDTKIEPDEIFSVVLSNARGAGFAGGGMTATATITIFDDDGGGSAGKVVAGPAFALVGGPDPTVTAEVASVLRLDAMKGAGLISSLSGQLASGAITQAQAAQAVVTAATSTTEVATLAYQFFTGKTPSAAGMDYLISPAGPNPNNLNSDYYAKFDVTNRFINFASNLGKIGEGAAAFQSAYGGLNLTDATTKAYTAIFGSAPTADKVSHILHDAVPNGLGGTYEREDYFAAYGLGGQGTKAAMVGWLLGVAATGDLGVYAKSDDAFLLDVAGGKASFGVDLVGTYAKPDYVYRG